MSDLPAPESNPAPPPAATAGGLLRAARERSGLPVEEFAELLKVTPRRVELIEADQFDQLPDPVFVRALAQTMCRTLKIDPAPVLALLPQAIAHRLDRMSVGLNTPFRDAPAQLLPDDWIGKLLPFLGGAGLLAAGALLFYFLPSNWQPSAKVSPRTVTAPPAMPAAASQIPPAPTVVAEAAVLRPETAHLVSPAAARTTERGVAAPTELGRAAPNPTLPPRVVPAPAGAMAASIASAVPAAPAPPVGRAASAAAPVAIATRTLAAAAPAGLLQLRTSEAAWVQVHDAQGALLFSRELRAGEAVGLNGATPLKVTVGNVKATQIAFRGKAMDLRSFTRDNVARIELQ